MVKTHALIRRLLAAHLLKYAPAVLAHSTVAARSIP